eukprot:scaffold36476_cov252-Amphora_coffeaeformis.AAC.11
MSSRSTDFCIALSTLPWRQGQTISMDWLYDVVVDGNSSSSSAITSDHVLREKEGALVTDRQEVEWKIVSIGYREA